MMALTRNYTLFFFTLFSKKPPLFKPPLNLRTHSHPPSPKPTTHHHHHHLSTSLPIQHGSSPSSPLMSNKAKRRAYRDSPEGVLRHELDMCSKRGDVVEAIRLYDDARRKVLLLSDSDDGKRGGVDLGLERGFEIFEQMGRDGIDPNEATFTSAARLAARMEDPERAFELVKKMGRCGILPKLRSYGPALFGFCEKGEADRAYEVDTHMGDSGVAAEEPELAALLRLSVGKGKGDKVYEILHRVRASVRQVSEATVGVVEDWFCCDASAKVGEESWDTVKVKEGVVKGGGGWHGQGWLGKGKWEVSRTEMDKSGVCCSCGEKLVSIDINPLETEKFTSSLSKLASQKEVRASFNDFKEWLRSHGPFDAVIDGANVGLVNSQHFSFFQLNSVVNQACEMSPTKKLPLVILHTSRVHGGPAQNPKNKKLLETWRKSGALYVTPVGSNDDWYWLFAAVSCKSLLITNDEMRDHLFQLLGTSFFPRWKEKHQVRLSVSRAGLNLHMPPPYSIVIQESEGGSWHVPTVVGDDIETPRQWLCAMRASSMHLSTPSLKPRIPLFIIHFSSLLFAEKTIMWFDLESHVSFAAQRVLILEISRSASIDNAEPEGYVKLQLDFAKHC
ncbi:hypothetical protein Sjap_021726 [Stephania japonica]|uniref:ribonuclease P n=1 Tax=Stephania japonica TaxID=461633 RepID=A0AAP0EMX3_9MAGN